MPKDPLEKSTLKTQSRITQHTPQGQYTHMSKHTGHL